MTYQLFIGDRTFSSWSLRGWLMLEKFGIPYRTTMVGLYSGTKEADLADLFPARTVPVLRTPEGDILTDSLAMAETLVERHPEIALYPKDATERALCRSLVAEMHSGFTALRGACPMMLAHGFKGYSPDQGVLSDLQRIELLWTTAMDRHGGAGPWLFGDYTLADVFYAPIAARIATYGLPVGDRAQAYMVAHLSDPSFRQWRAMGLTKSYDPVPYQLDLPQSDWPGPLRLAARAVQSGPSENDICPYSGDPVTHFLELDGRVFGFCNAFCRDKTVADPGAWPGFTAIYDVA